MNFFLPSCFLFLIGGFIIGFQGLRNMKIWYWISLMISFLFFSAIFKRYAFEWLYILYILGLGAGYVMYKLKSKPKYEVD